MIIMYKSQSFNNVTDKKRIKVLDPPGNEPKTFGPLTPGHHYLNSRGHNLQTWNTYQL
jgi:hypothetical protein